MYCIKSSISHEPACIANLLLTVCIPERNISNTCNQDTSCSLLVFVLFVKGKINWLEDLKNSPCKEGNNCGKIYFSIT